MNPYLITYSNEAVNLAQVTKLHSKKNVVELKGPDGYTFGSITLKEAEVSMVAAVLALGKLSEMPMSTVHDFQRHYSAFLAEAEKNQAL